LFDDLPPVFSLSGFFDSSLRKYVLSRPFFWSPPSSRCCVFVYGCDSPDSLHLNFLHPLACVSTAFHLIASPCRYWANLISIRNSFSPWPSSVGVIAEFSSLVRLVLSCSRFLFLPRDYFPRFDFPSLPISRVRLAFRKFSCEYESFSPWTILSESECIAFILLC